MIQVKVLGNWKKSYKRTMSSKDAYSGHEEGLKEAIAYLTSLIPMAQARDRELSLEKKIFQEHEARTKQKVAELSEDEKMDILEMYVRNATTDTP